MKDIARYKVIVTPTAELDLVEGAEYIARDSNAAARKWLYELRQMAESLATMPLRFGRAREGAPYRQVIVHSHRVIYRVDEELQTVTVMRFYHAARRRWNKRKS